MAGVQYYYIFCTYLNIINTIKKNAVLIIITHNSFNIINISFLRKIYFHFKWSIIFKQIEIYYKNKINKNRR